MRGKASCLRREKRPTHLMCVVGASIKQQSVWRKEETCFLFFFFVIKKGRKRMKKVSFTNKRTCSY